MTGDKHHGEELVATPRAMDVREGGFRPASTFTFVLWGTTLPGVQPGGSRRMIYKGPAVVLVRGDGG